MSIPGVESARRRRASHGRSLPRFLPVPRLPLACFSSDPASGVGPLDFRRFSFHSRRPLNSITPSSANIIRSAQRDKLAMAARNRLHDRLRAADKVGRRPPSSEGSLPDTVWNEDEILEPRLRKWLAISSGFFFLQKLRLRGENFTSKIQGMGSDCEEEDDCPVCIDRFLSGQIVVTLPCEHKFHTDCVIPWLESHHNCPFCRANVSKKLPLKSPPSQTK